MKDEIVEAIRDRMPEADVEVAVEGNGARIRVVSREFTGLSRVQRTQAVNVCIERFISEGRLHAVSIRTLTPDEAG